MIYQLKSTQNEKFKYFKSLNSKKDRIKNSQYIVEGIKSVQDAISAQENICYIIVSESFYSDISFPYPLDVDIYIITDSMLSTISTTKNPQGIIAILKIKTEELVLDINIPYIYCDRIQDPGNLGTIIRTADAAGFGGIILSPDCVDLYNPKTVRASMGSFFHIKKFEMITIKELANFKNDGFMIYTSTLSDNTIEYTDSDMTKPFILVVGNEANGVCADIIEISDVTIKIPIDGRAESLNAAVASSIMMYECRRQRHNK